MTAKGTRTALEVILTELGPLAGQSVLDVGCGRGGLRAPLTGAGALWRGLDPFPASGAVDTDVGNAESMPYPDAQFDAAVCVNALHHVPVPVMGAALAEVARVLRPKGLFVVIEPQASGALSRVIAVVDDETAIRGAAQSAMDATRALIQIGAYDYARVERYADFGAFSDSLIAVDPARAEVIAKQSEPLREAFEASAGREDGFWTLSQPMSVRLFRPAIT